ncbi:hypothetical protein GCM10010430_49780 [Kitasatospora cystarginea]|uniref:Uncharacterized protein n=1 Tax=Kitasatospora cystarginea TaxID=58350 RepID=A0ABN3EJ13_9ACTN
MAGQRRGRRHRDAGRRSLEILRLTVAAVRTPATPAAAALAMCLTPGPQAGLSAFGAALALSTLPAYEVKGHPQVRPDLHGAGPTAGTRHICDRRGRTASPARGSGWCGSPSEAGDEAGPQGRFRGEDTPGRWCT